MSIYLGIALTAFLAQGDLDKNCFEMLFEGKIF